MGLLKCYFAMHLCMAWIAEKTLPGPQGRKTPLLAGSPPVELYALRRLSAFISFAVVPHRSRSAAGAPQVFWLAVAAAACAVPRHHAEQRPGGGRRRS